VAATSLLTTSSSHAIYTMNCHSCKPPEADQDRIILRTVHQDPDQVCRAVLRRDRQGEKGWIGRSVIHPEIHYTDSTNVPDSTDRAIKRARNILKTVCNRRFGMSRDNFAEAGNKDMDHKGEPTCDQRYHHYHWHFIPRYQGPVELFNVKYRDYTFTDALDIDPKEKVVPANKEPGTNIAFTAEQIPLLKEEMQFELVKMIFDPHLPLQLKPRWAEIAEAFPSRKVVELCDSLIQESANSGCGHCKKTAEKLSYCGRCHIQTYCSRTCQQADWCNHRLFCRITARKK
jgi:diadenosine tetraphosphate (Ap4A) HIT family hydrolase